MELLNEKQIERAAEIIRNGGIVAFRTETVYGLGADCTCESAVQKVFTAKGRPAAKALLVLFDSAAELYKFFPGLDEIHKKIFKKVRGGLTVVLPRQGLSREIAPSVFAGGNSLAVRVTSCKFTKKLIRACGVPLVAPSANTSGAPVPTNWNNVYNDLDKRIDAAVMGPDTKSGTESTIIKIENGKIIILRQGIITSQKIAKIAEKLGLTM